MQHYPALTPEQQDQLSQAIDKATSNKEIAQILQQAEAQAEENYKQGVKAEAIQAIDDAVKAKEMAIEKSDLTTEEKAALKGNVEAHANEAKATIATLDNDVEVAELASEAVTNITLMGMDDETAKATAKDTIAALSTLTPEQQDQLSQAIDKATSNKEIAQILQQAEAQAEENYKQGVKAEAEVHRKLVEAELGSTPNDSASAEAELTREELSKSGEFSNPDGFEEENLGDYYVGSEDEADATAEDFAGEFDKNDAHGKLVESELGATPNDSASAEAELTRRVIKIRGIQ
ncbi:DUF1542 domain-containing protein [Dolosigranulum pigrum]|uniref:DUF1542 domain-containing protein n=1 Tax=Dolosigranulum pigrum TaxID=29394 RepID=A0A516GHN5_9LACT|nr:DUF1542 domain-containing protein [Dolosigranulum pigrum]QDO91044.1 DUF1542 domain-containing protein [Dolosigranulum pigrum]